jgi:hypothetical protein
MEMVRVPALGDRVSGKRRTAFAISVAVAAGAAGLVPVEQIKGHETPEASRLWVSGGSERGPLEVPNSDVN